MEINKQNNTATNDSKALPLVPLSDDEMSTITGGGPAPTPPAVPPGSARPPKPSKPLKWIDPTF